MKKYICICAMAVILGACRGSGDEKKAENLLQEAQRQFEKGQFDHARMYVDSLRKTYPHAVGTRKKALKLYQDTELARAQKEVQESDLLFQKLNREYGQKKALVESHKAAGTATAEELTSLTLLRMKRDSARTLFDVQCAKIKYIHKRQKE